MWSARIAVVTGLTPIVGSERPGEVAMPKSFTVIIERDEDGFLVGTVPALYGCHTQARSMDELLERAREAISLCLEVRGEDTAAELELVGFQTVAV